MRLAEPVTRIAVDVTFLRMDRQPGGIRAALPAGVTVERLHPRATVAQYRALYDAVGQDYVWWLRRTLSDSELDRVLSDPDVSVDVARGAGQELGFFELDRRAWPSVNLAYFGLLPTAIGRGLGMGLLQHAIAAAWGEGCTSLTVNTCTADHPRALPNYLRAGFRRLRTIREEWPVPDRLGLPIPPALRI